MRLVELEAVGELGCNIKRSVEYVGPADKFGQRGTKKLGWWTCAERILRSMMPKTLNRTIKAFFFRSLRLSS
jgi:hypothetical protein